MIYKDDDFLRILTNDALQKGMRNCDLLGLSTDKLIAIAKPGYAKGESPFRELAKQTLIRRSHLRAQSPVLAASSWLCTTPPSGRRPLASEV